MDEAKLGRAFRAVRIRKGWRQEDLAGIPGVSQRTVSRLERGHIAGAPLGTLRRLADALGIRLTVEARWEGAELDRLLAARHSAMHEAVARLFKVMPDWALSPEVTFSIFGERGVIDILCWHAATRTLLVIELKTELVDVQETVGTLDRKVRLAAKVAADRGWEPVTVACWLLVADGGTNRRRVQAHRTMLRNALPADGRSMTGWLRDPRGTIRALSFLTATRGVSDNRRLAQVHRVRRPKDGAARATT
jgi:transcriptional regulator with XRE-family HTH domain